MADIYEMNREMLRDAFTRVFTNTTTDLREQIRAAQERAMHSENYSEIQLCVSEVDKLEEELNRVIHMFEDLRLGDDACERTVRWFVSKTCNGSFSIGDEEEGS